MDRPHSPHNAGEEIHLGDYIRVIRKRLWLFVGVFILVAAAGTVYTFLITPEYQAEIKLEILDTPEGGMNLLAGLGGLKGDRIDTEIEKIRSRDVARAVVLNRDLVRSQIHPQPAPAFVLHTLESILVELPHNPRPTP